MSPIYLLSLFIISSFTITFSQKVSNNCTQHTNNCVIDLFNCDVNQPMEVKCYCLEIFAKCLAVDDCFNSTEIDKELKYICKNNGFNCDICLTNETTHDHKKDRTKFYVFWIIVAVAGLLFLSLFIGFLISHKTCCSKKHKRSLYTQDGIPWQLPQGV